MDKYFKVEVLRKTPNPQQLIYMALHQDYSENFVVEELDKIPSESKCGEIAIDRLLKGDRNHWGCFEHPQISFNCGYFPHSVMQQARTHRISVSFDVQSGRYTGKRILAIAEKFPKLDPYNSTESALIEHAELIDDIEKTFYLRPIGHYADRQGKKYYYDNNMRHKHIVKVADAILDYSDDIKKGMSEEHARGLIPFDIRQHFVVSFNLRSLLHFLDLRSKKDAQLEIQQLCNLMLPHLHDWCPQVSGWYTQNRLHRAKLAP